MMPFPTTTQENRMSRPEQTEIPGEGFERKVIADIETAANAYRNARDERMEMTKLEVVRRDELIAVMQQHATGPRVDACA